MNDKHGIYSAVHYLQIIAELEEKIQKLEEENKKLRKNKEQK